ncbi:MAG TPA: galactokinase family protein [Bacteroidota bacterium]|nr:galactokinase family protein [Bacteroidota bacterium]
MTTFTDNLNRSMADELVVSTPGRICLFGEHQDYLHLPVIPAAISLRITFEARRRRDSLVHISLPDVHSSVSFPLEGNLGTLKPGDYFRSAVQVLRKAGFAFLTGFDCVVRSTIPIKAGTSSSSALVVSWVNILAQISEQHSTLHPDRIACYAHEAEVVAFHQAGGMMDQFSTAYGGVLLIDFFPDICVEPLKAELKNFVLGNSGEPKDTQEILSRVKSSVLDVVKRLSEKHADFSLRSATPDSIAKFKRELTDDQALLLEGTVQNHEITKEARRLLQTHPLDHQRLGALLTKHQSVLRDVQRISTPKVDRMLDAALHAGAYGGKINGSGGGGCMFAYAPEHTEQVAEAIEGAGGKAYAVTVDEGTRNEPGPALNHGITFG